MQQQIKGMIVLIGDSNLVENSRNGSSYLNKDAENTTEYQELEQSILKDLCKLVSNLSKLLSN
jgi:hypothetical protein